MEFLPRNFTTADLTLRYPNGPEYGGRWIEVVDIMHGPSRVFDWVGVDPATYREVDPVTKQPLGPSESDVAFLREIGIKREFWRAKNPIWQKREGFTPNHDALREAMVRVYNECQVGGNLPNMWIIDGVLYTRND